MRYARNVHFQIKPGKDQEFTKLMQSEVIPTLKKQDGFRSEVALVNGQHALGISLWNDRASAEKYATTGYPQLLTKLGGVIEATPKVETFEVAATTITG